MSNIQENNLCITTISIYILITAKTRCCVFNISSCSNELSLEEQSLQLFSGMSENIPLVRSLREVGHGARASGSGARPVWAIALLASVLIFTTIVDVLGNLLVIISVFRNRKLRNVGEQYNNSLSNIISRDLPNLPVKAQAVIKKLQI